MFGMITLEHWQYPLQGALHGLEYTAEGHTTASASSVYGG